MSVTRRTLPAVAECDVPESAEQTAPRPTRLEHFLRSRRIKPAHLARETGYSREYLYGIRFDSNTNAALLCIAAIVVSLRRLARERVRPDQLFDPEVIQTAWRETPLTDLEYDQRAELRATFGERKVREFLAKRTG